MNYISLLPSGILLYIDNTSYFYRYEDGHHTPYYRFPKISKKVIDKINTKEFIILNKKKYYKNFERYFTDDNLYDLNTLLWSHHLDTVDIPNNDYLAEHIGTIQQTIPTLKNLNLTYPKENNIIVKACSILDGKIKVNGKIYNKNFNHWTKSGRMRDTAGTVSIPKEEKKLVDFQNGYLYIDMKNFHLRIIDNTLDINEIPEDMDALDYLAEESLLPRDKLKTEVFRTLYSERFDINHSWFKTVKENYKKLKAILRPSKEFNYKIQQWESYLMAQFIIDNRHLTPLFYLYDGIIFDSNKPETIINNIGYPFSSETNQK